MRYIQIQGILDRVNWQEHGFDQVLTANSYSQAVNIIISHNVDVLLSDIEMPHGSGLDLVKWVKEHSPETECVFLTCHDDFNYAKHAINMKCLDYVLKPASKTVLDDVLRKAEKTVEQKRKDET
jgi:YesN/AraC family two-component response regulator